MADLKLLREQIQTIDTQILELASERMKLCRKVGEYKRENQLPIKDYKVEKQIIEKTRQQANSLGIEPDLAVDLIKGLIKYSVIEQDQIKSNYQVLGEQDLKKVLIIGGAGNMGLWMAQFFAGLGYQVHIHDCNQTRDLRFEFQPDLHKGLEWADITVLALPLNKTNDMILKLAKIKTKSLILEICSLKSPIQQGLSTAKEAGLRIVSTHPMFGHDVKVLAGRNIIICSNDEHCKDTEFVTSIFKQTSANVLKIPHELHDSYMSIVLGSTHLFNILYASSIIGFGVPFDELEQVAGTTFSKQIEVTKTVVNENADLYFDIQTLNTESKKVVASIKEALHLLEIDIENSDRSRFKEKMNRSATFLKTEKS